MQTASDWFILIIQSLIFHHCIPSSVFRRVLVTNSLWWSTKKVSHYFGGASSSLFGRAFKLSSSAFRRFFPFFSSLRASIGMSAAVATTSVQQNTSHAPMTIPSFSPTPLRVTSSLAASKMPHAKVVSKFWKLILAFVLFQAHSQNSHWIGPRCSHRRHIPFSSRTQTGSLWRHAG